jgi:hypothetical protein
MMRATTFLVTLLCLLAVAGCTAADESTGDPGLASSSEDAKIYAAAIRQIYSVDHSFGEPPAWPLVYVVNRSEDLVMLDAPFAPSQDLTPELQAAIQAELGDQPFELIWIDNVDEAPIDPSNGQVAEGKGIVVTVGNIHRQKDGTIQMSFFMNCGGLCGIGKVYVLSQVAGAWRVTGSVGPEIMS